MRFSTHFELVGGSSMRDHGAFTFGEVHDRIPFVDDPSFIEDLNELVLGHDIGLVYPAHDAVVLSLAEAQAAGALSCPVVGSPVSTARLARSKSQTYARLAEVIRVPVVHAAGRALPWPVFLKPDVGQGSKGAHIVRDAEEMDYLLRRDTSLIITEYLPGAEYTVDCFTDIDGTLLFVGPRTRSRVSNGISVNSSTAVPAGLCSSLEVIADAINAEVPFTGAWFFQVKLDSAGEPCLLEIAPRIAGTSGVTRARGVNLPLMSSFSALGVRVELGVNQGEVEVDRALGNRFRLDVDYRTVYMDLDDIILHGDQVNLLAIAFIHQCHNEGKTVQLLTRHAKDVRKTLVEHRISELFDFVHHVERGAKKSDFIASKDAIFIDDSFAERREVADALGIPVFDLHMLESLIKL